MVKNRKKFFFFDHFWILWDVLGVFLACFSTFCDRFMTFWAPLNGPKVPKNDALDLSGSGPLSRPPLQMDHFWSIFGHFWIIFGPFLGHFWDISGTFLGHFWVIFGTFWDIFGTFLDIFGTFLGHFWDIFGTFWDTFGTILCHFWDIFWVISGHRFSIIEI